MMRIPVVIFAALWAIGGVACGNGAPKNDGQTSPGGGAQSPTPSAAVETPASSSSDARASDAPASSSDESGRSPSRSPSPAASPAARPNNAARGPVNTLPENCTAAKAVSATQVSMRGSAYQPSCIKVTAGTSVTFTNDDTVPHTVTAVEGSSDVFDSGFMAVGATFAHTFGTAGSLGIACTYHHAMVMGVIINAP